MSERNHLPESWTGWTITGEIGAGSYGKVYEAGLDSGDHAEKAAVKIIRIPADDAEAAVLAHELPERNDQIRYYENLVDGLLAEIHAMEALRDNPHAVRLEDYYVEHEEGSLSWTIYIRMELLTPFEDYKVDHEITEETVRKLGLDMCDVLSECEKRSILHRDIKTENIMVAEDGNFKLGDFGLARQMKITTGSLSLKGSFSYMSPEVFHGEHYDTRADQYSLGIVLYRLLNRNRDPFTDPDAGMVYYRDREESLQRRMKGEPLPPPADASEGMAAVIAKACAFSPDDRYKNIAALRRDLQSCAGGRPGPVYGARKMSPSVRKKRRKWPKARILALCIAAFLVLAGAVTAILLSGRDKTPTSGNCGDALRWKLTRDGTLTISGTGMMNNYEVLRPAPWRWLDFETLTMEEGATGIGSWAFRMNATMTSLHLPESLEYIGEGAFNQCWDLSSITIGKNVSYVGPSVFSDCIRLETILVDRDNPVYDSRNYCNALIETATDTLVAGCAGTTIPDSVKAIGPRAFHDCIRLKEISIPPSVTAIDSTAFEGCSELMIRGKSGSEAETFAKRFGFAFEEIP
ncbi:MAG: protein kinase [Lachnospiraceae bacterium]|nr:protein kinase [Lachnospiraceae bacterium]